MTKDSEIHKAMVTVERIKDYEFRVRFDNPQYPELILDEPEPVGHDIGPNATRVLSAAVGNCLAASLMFCLQRSKQQVDAIRSEVIAQTKRNQDGRWRVAQLDVKIIFQAPESDEPRVKRCLEIFENYCIVTSSVRQGIPVKVEVIQEE
jgi:uncharacterized OsmC-like protein